MKNQILENDFWSKVFDYHKLEIKFKIFSQVREYALPDPLPFNQREIESLVNSVSEATCSGL